MTVKELAALAGVSPATISLVLNGKKGVSEEKRKAILKIIEENKYNHQRKMDARSRNILFLKYSRDGMILEENTNFVSAIMDGAESACQEQNFNFAITMCEGNLEEILKNINYGDFYGIMILGTELDERDYRLLKVIPIPYIVVDNSMPHFDCNCVVIDNRENVFKAIQYFAQQGAKEVGYFRSGVRIQNFIEREQGFWEAVKYFDLKVSKESVFEVPPTMLGAFERTQEYIAEGARIPPCLFVDNDTMTIGVMKALKIADFDIPGDASIIGFDDINFCTIYSPTISTIHVNKRMLGKMALATLRNMAEIEDFKNVKIRISGELKLRQSTR